MIKCNSNSFFRSQPWSDHLHASFGTEHLLLTGESDILISIFSMGFIRVAIPNFPLGLQTESDYLTIKCSESRKRLKEERVDILRETFFPHIPAPMPEKQILSYQPRSIIENLSDWSDKSLKKSVRYEVRKPTKRGINIRSANASDAESIYQIYRSTIAHHKGNNRYPAAYFRNFLRRFENHSDVNVYLAENESEDVLGFTITINDGDCCYYLHGGFLREYSKLSIGYALMHRAIEQAKTDGCTTFDMLASPENQPDLVRFKALWGAVTHDQLSIDVPVSSILGPCIICGTKFKKKYL